MDKLRAIDLVETPELAKEIMDRSSASVIIYRTRAAEDGARSVRSEKSDVGRADFVMFADGELRHQFSAVANYFAEIVVDSRLEPEQAVLMLGMAINDELKKRFPQR